jgi:hypothetical protein
MTVSSSEDLANLHKRKEALCKEKRLNLVVKAKFSSFRKSFEKQPSLTLSLAFSSGEKRDTSRHFSCFLSGTVNAPRLLEIDIHW